MPTDKTAAAPATPPAAAPTATSPGITPVDGITTLDEKIQFEPQRLSYDAVDRIAQKIGAKVSHLIADKTVVIVDTSVLSDISNLQAIKFELCRLAAEYKGLAEAAKNLFERQGATEGDQGSDEADDEDEGTGAGNKSVNLTGLNISKGLISKTIGSDALKLASSFVPGVTAVTAAVTAGLGLVSLFRQDVEYKGSDTAIDKLSLQLALGAHLHADKPTAKVFLSDLLNLPALHAEHDCLQARILQVEAARRNVWLLIAPLVTQLADLDVRLDEAARDKDQNRLDQLTKQAASVRHDLQPVSDPLSRADKSLSDLNMRLTQIAADSGLSFMALMLRIEALHHKKPLFLHCAAVSSGGSYRLVHTLWRTLFSGDGVTSMGGAVVRWGLLNDDGSLLAGGIKTACVESKEV
jgi:hypothetical protein